jgi:hypothetical protein
MAVLSLTWIMTSGARPRLCGDSRARKFRSGFALCANGGGGWIRTSVRLRGQIYSLLPLTTRPPLREDVGIVAGAPCGGAAAVCQRDNALHELRCLSPLRCASSAPKIEMPRHFGLSPVASLRRSKFRQSTGLPEFGAGEATRPAAPRASGESLKTTPASQRPYPRTKCPFCPITDSRAASAKRPLPTFVAPMTLG